MSTCASKYHWFVYLWCLFLITCDVMRNLQTIMLIIGHGWWRLIHFHANKIDWDLFLFCFQWSPGRFTCAMIVSRWQSCERYMTYHTVLRGDSFAFTNSSDALVWNDVYSTNHINKVASYAWHTSSLLIFVHMPAASKKTPVNNKPKAKATCVIFCLHLWHCLIR